MKLAKPEIHHSPASAQMDIKETRAAVLEAVEAVERATQKCLIAGQRLNEWQEKLPFGEFQRWIEKHIPEVSYDTANRWARAAGNVAKRIPEPTIDIPVSVILSTPADDLPPEARKYRQAWFDFTQDKTIKNCLDDVCVGGDEGHRVDRALNGKLQGGTNPHDDRKDFPLFTAECLKVLSGHLSHWKKLTALQRSEIEQIFRASILGHGTTLNRKAPRTFPYNKPWPDSLTRLLLNICKERLKGGTDDE